jgi:plasmid stabilization system protein ParE
LLPLPLEIRLSPEASDDLDAVLQFTLEQWGEVQMEKYASFLQEAMTLLANFPYLGRKKDHLRVGCLCYQVGSHQIYYDTTNTLLRISRIVHIRTDEEAIF